MHCSFYFRAERQLENIPTFFARSKLKSHTGKKWSIANFSSEWKSVLRYLVNLDPRVSLAVLLTDRRRSHGARLESRFATSNRVKVNGCWDHSSSVSVRVSQFVEHNPNLEECDVFMSFGVILFTAAGLPRIALTSALTVMSIEKSLQYKGRFKISRISSLQFASCIKLKVTSFLNY